MNQWAANGKRQDEERYGQFGNSWDNASNGKDCSMGEFCLLYNNNDN